MYDLLIFIGRMQPMHKGHQDVIEEAQRLAKNVLVILGSKNTAISTRNPFTYEERRDLVKTVYPGVFVRGVPDTIYNDTQWVAEIQRIVANVSDQIGSVKRIGVIGYAKDHTSFYLKLFPQWGFHEVQALSEIHATGVREIFSKPHQGYELHTVLSKPVVDFITHWQSTSRYDQFVSTMSYLRDYKKQYGPGPHLTADALVQVSGHILLVTRGKEYGQGLLAMPGGFLNPDEKFLDASIRELKEETRLKVPVPVLKGSIAGTFLADNPSRSERGRIVSNVIHFKLQNESKLPEVRGSDDADHADWYELSSLKSEMFFEDHYSIISEVIGVY